MARSESRNVQVAGASGTYGRHSSKFNRENLKGDPEGTIEGKCLVPFLASKLDSAKRDMNRPDPAYSP
ncbi:MAG: hypothetical protein QMD16_10675 [Desulfitobacteriaceae bacterium]|nr:hypothetical protein [Desulfitobacteriaceae bacterium]